MRRAYHKGMTAEEIAAEIWKLKEKRLRGPSLAAADAQAVRTAEERARAARAAYEATAERFATLLGRRALELEVSMEVLRACRARANAKAKADMRRTDQGIEMLRELARAAE